MSKRSTKAFSVPLATVFFCGLFLIPVSSLRCAHDCELDAVPFNTTDPFKTPCQTMEVDGSTSVCFVFLNVDYRDRTISAGFNAKHSNILSSALRVRSTLFPHMIETFISYQCSITDNCDQEFVRETISSDKWDDLKEGELREKLNSLLYNRDESVEQILCDNHLVCERFEHCEAELIRNDTLAQPERFIFNNKFLCNNASDGKVVYDQHFYENGKDSFAMLEVICNKNGCNDERTVRAVYETLAHDFVLPLNYSQYIPFVNGVQQRKVSVFLFLFFSFNHLFLMC